MKIILKLWSFVFFLIFVSQVCILSEDTGFTISGEVYFKKNHDITIEVINKEEYDKNLASEYVVVINIDKDWADEKKAAFSIPGVPAGDYIVKVYQDLNGNGKFDFALIGGEPIATYRKPGFTIGRPSFKSLAFKLTSGLEGIEIKL